MTFSRQKRNSILDSLSTVLAEQQQTESESYFFSALLSLPVGSHCEPNVPCLPSDNLSQACFQPFQQRRRINFTNFSFWKLEFWKKLLRFPQKPLFSFEIQGLLPKIAPKVSDFLSFFKQKSLSFGRKLLSYNVRVLEPRGKKNPDLSSSVHTYRRCRHTIFTIADNKNDVKQFFLLDKCKKCSLLHLNSNLLWVFFLCGKNVFSLKFFSIQYLLLF